MLDLLDSPSTNTCELLAALASSAGSPRARGYAGPERRGAASLQHRRLAQMLDTLDYGMLLISETHGVGKTTSCSIAVFLFLTLLDGKRYSWSICKKCP